jgi:sugar phosphate isomerase/epimerase
MPAYVSTSVFKNGTSVENAIESLLDLGINNIELGSVHNYEENIVATVAHYDAKFLSHNFFPPAPGRLVLNIASSDEKIRKASLAFIKEGIDFAEKMDIPLYTIHPGFVADPLAESDSKDSYDFHFAANAAGDAKAAFEHFLNSMFEIEKYIEDKDVKIAVETQGAVEKKDLVLLARPQELERFLKTVQSKKIGLNLNLGHLNLAASVWGFDRKEFVDQIKSRVFAVEVTHNEGVNDEHKPLKMKAWYLDILKDEYFKSIPVIFEGRFTTENDIMDSFNLLASIVGE